jgi:hypothetical protein
VNNNHFFLFWEGKRYSHHSHFLSLLAGIVIAGIMCFGDFIQMGTNWDKGHQSLVPLVDVSP